MQLKSEHIYPRMVELRRTFHREPELAFEEVRTAQIIMAELKHLGIPYEYMGQGGGVIGRLTGGGSHAPTVALRAEMDALPGEESTGLPFASRIKARSMLAAMTPIWPWCWALWRFFEKRR